MYQMKRFIALGVVTFGLTAASALAADDPAEKGAVPSVIPPSPDESGLVRNPPAWTGTSVAVVEPVTKEAPVAPAAGNTVDDFFARYDTNRDGVISWQEAQADPDLAHAFTRGDANQDGVLTRAEFQDAALIARADRNSASGGSR